MRLPAMLFTPIHPMRTGLATYALRVLEGTSGIVDWTVAYPDGGDPACLPEGVSAVGIDALLAAPELHPVRIFNIGNSLDCLPVVRALYAFGGTSLLHETVLHHLHRYGWESIGMPGEYDEELRFSCGPSAGRTRRLLDRPGKSETEYDALLKQYPLIGRVLHHSTGVAVLNEYSLAAVSGAFPGNRVMTVGHPLSPLPELESRNPRFCYTVLMAGGCHPGRNLTQVLGAMESLRKEVPGAGLLLLGEGYPPDMPDWAESMGRLPEAAYQEWIRTADAAVDFRHPTCGETSGSLLEVMRAGVPCITSDSGAYAYLPSEGVIRVPVESGADGIAAALSYLRRLPDAGKSIGSCGADYAGRTGSEDRLSADWKALISMALSSAADRGQEAAGSMADRSAGWSLSAAWHPAPAGFLQDMTTHAVSWGFDGSASIEGPQGAEAAMVTAWGKGTLNGIDLPDGPESVEVRGGRLVFEGEGRVTGVRWLRAGNR